MTAEVKNSYTSKINANLTQALTSWWNNLSKEEILEYLKNQPSVTADSLRKLFADTNTQLVFSTSFETNSSSASADFSEEP